MIYFLFQELEMQSEWDKCNCCRHGWYFRSSMLCFSSFFEVWRPVIQMDSFLCVLFKFVKLQNSLIKLERENFWIRNLSTKKKWPRFLHDWVCIYKERFVIRDFIPIWNHQSTLLKNLLFIARSIYLLRKNWKIG